ncbi:hypothetical protein CQZ94_09100 [Bacillus sp. MYb209]|nr:hypothetical protein CQZ94_09100 [Bacillus sp. MYb209]
MSDGIKCVILRKLNRCIYLKELNIGDYYACSYEDYIFITNKRIYYLSMQFLTFLFFFFLSLPFFSNLL